MSLPETDAEDARVLGHGASDDVGLGEGAADGVGHSLARGVQAALGVLRGRLGLMRGTLARGGHVLRGRSKRGRRLGLGVLRALARVLDGLDDGADDALLLLHGIRKDVVGAALGGGRDRRLRRAQRLGFLRGRGAQLLLDGDDVVDLDALRARGLGDGRGLGQPLAQGVRRLDVIFLLDEAVVRVDAEAEDEERRAYQDALVGRERWGQRGGPDGDSHRKLSTKPLLRSVLGPCGPCGGAGAPSGTASRRRMSSHACASEPAGAFQSVGGTLPAPSASGPGLFSGGGGTSGDLSGALAHCCGGRRPALVGCLAMCCAQVGTPLGARRRRRVAYIARREEKTEKRTKRSSRMNWSEGGRTGAAISQGGQATHKTCPRRRWR